MGLSTTALAFAAAVGGGDPATQVVTVSNLGGGSLSVPSPIVTYAVGGASGWLDITVTGDAAPYTIAVQARIGALAAGVHRAELSVACAGAAESPGILAITFSVSAQPAVVLSATALSFTASAGGTDPDRQQFTVDNGGAGALSFPSMTLSYGEGSGWLEVTISGAGAPFSVAVQPRLGTLQPGVYHANISVACDGAAGSPATVTVTFSVESPLPAPQIGLSATALSFAAVVGAADPAAQIVTVTNAGTGIIAVPSASVAYVGGAGGWLDVTVAGDAEPYTVTVQPRTGALAAGVYRADVGLDCAGAIDTPRLVSVTVSVDRPPSMAVSPPSLALTAAADSGAPVGATVTVANAGGGDLAAPVADVSYPAGAPAWIASVAVSGVGAPYGVTVTADSAGLAIGRYEANLRLTAVGAANSPLDVPLRLDVGHPITVTRLTTRWFEDGTTQVMAVDEVATIEVAAPDGNGGLVAFPLGAVAPGTWSAVLPVTPGFWVIVGWKNGTRSYVWTTAETIDLGVDLAGRDATPDDLSSVLAIALSGLEPWSAANDVLQAFSFDARASVAAYPGFVDGQTSGTFTIDFTRNVLPLLVPTDRLWIAQGVASPTAASPADRVVSYRAVTQVTGIAMPRGVWQAWTAVTAPPVVQPSTLDSIALDWKTSQFEAGLPPLDTSVNPPEHFARVFASPVPLAAPSPSDAWSMELMRLGFFAPHADTDFGTLSWGRLLPSTWHSALSVHYFGFVPRSAPGMPAKLLRCSISVTDELASAPAVAVPRVTMIRSPKVDGVDVATSPISGVGITPTLTWDPPAVGQPTSYRIELSELAPSGGFGTSKRVVANAVVYQPSFQVPAGLLQVGKAYVARIEAMVTPTDASTSQPWRTGLPMAAASVYTETFAP